MHFTCAARTDVGIVRSGNEDNYMMLAEQGIFIVADGMGGHAAGEVASEMAVRITSQTIGSLRGVQDEEAGERIRTAIRAANDAIFERTWQFAAHVSRLPEPSIRQAARSSTVRFRSPDEVLVAYSTDRATTIERFEVAP